MNALLLPGFDAPDIASCASPGRVTFNVDGIPVPQGSMRAFVVAGRARLTHNKGGQLAVWRSAVAMAAQEAMGTLPAIPGAVFLTLTFRLVRPKTVSPRKRPHPTSAPDLDKLVRAVLDALTSVVYVDDSQVVSVLATKVYCDGARPGVSVTVEPVES